jgi:hypothetical protein
MSEKAISVYFLRTKLVAGTARHGFEVINIDTFVTQALLDPDGPAIPETGDKKLKCLALYRLEDESLLCYDSYLFYFLHQNLPF